MGKLNELPAAAQSELRRYLEADNFRAAKELYDYFITKDRDSLFQYKMSLKVK